MEKRYLIIPACDDTNRGDQALIWETVSIAREAGYVGKFYMTAESEKSKQSKANGIGQIDCILPHPSVHFKANNNVRYKGILKLKWIIVSIFDCFFAILILVKPFRKLAKRFYPHKIKRSICIFEKADAAFVKGGGFLHSYGGLVNTYANFYDLYHIILAQVMGIPVYVLPNSFGPFLSPGTSWMVKKVMSKCRFVAVRESISRDLVKRELGLSFELFPDLAFYLKKENNFSKEQKANLEKIPWNNRCVALTVRPYRFPGHPDPEKAYFNYKNSIAEFVQYLSAHDYHPVLVEHTFSNTEHERDISCIHDIERILKNTCSYSVFSDLSLDCRQLKYVYSKFQYLVGTRFHSVIFSIASGIPSIAITYGGNKGKGIMTDIGLGEFAISIDEIDSKRLISLFEKLEKNKDNVHEKLVSYTKICETKKKELIKQMKEED